MLRQGLAEKLALTVNTISTGAVSGERFDAAKWSFTVKDITDQMVFELELLGSDGVLVEGVRTGGAAHRGGLRRGVVIEAVEGERIKSLQDFEQHYESLTKAETPRVLLQVRRYESQAYVLLQINRREGKDSAQ